MITNGSKWKQALSFDLFLCSIVDYSRELACLKERIFFFKVMKQFEELWKTLSGQIWGFYTPEVKKYILIAFFYNPVETFFFF